MGLAADSLVDAALSAEKKAPTFERPEDEELRKILESRKAEIKVIGVGGSGNNTISRLMPLTQMRRTYCTQTLTGKF